MTIPKWITKAYEEPNYQPHEGGASQGETVEKVPLMRGDRHGPAPVGIPMTARTQNPDEKPKGPGKAEMSIKGEQPAQLPPDLQNEQDLLKQKEINFNKAQSFTRLNAGRALAQTKAMAQEIYANDATAMKRLNQQHYARWEKENAQFRKDIDAARQLRVNPDNYLQRMGRSGRVSSVLAVAVGQIAAGAGNPNMVWNRLKSAIDQDINTQKANIELEFAGITAGQNQQNHEAAMLEKYYGFEDKARAVAMSSLEAQVGVIMQRAANENEYQAYQMIGSRARAERLDATAAGLAKNATLYLDAPTYSAYQALIKSHKWQEAQAMFQAGIEQQVGGAQPVDTSIQSYDENGQPVIFGGQQQPAGQPLEAPQPPAEATPAPAVAKVAKRRPAAPGPSSPEEQLVTPSAPTTPEQAPTAPEQTPTGSEQDYLYGEPLTPEQAQRSVEGAGTPMMGKAEREAADERLRTKARAAEVEKGIRRRMGDKLIQEGGYQYRLQKERGISSGALEGLGINTFLQGRDIILDPTDPEIAVFPSYVDAKEGLKYDFRTGPRAAYEKAHPELYEQNLFVEHEGTKGGTSHRWLEQNYLVTDWGDIKLAKASTYRNTPGKRDEQTEAINQDFLRVQNIYSQAKAIAATGAGSLAGFQMTEDGLTWPGDQKALEALQTKKSGALQLAIQAMKLVDPSGRLTDQDIIVGKEYVLAALQNHGLAAVETVESIYRRLFNKDVTKGHARRAIQKALRAMAAHLSDSVALLNKHNFVMSYDQHMRFQRGALDVDKWMMSYERDKDKAAAKKRGASGGY